MANLAGLRTNQYYFYVESYNALAEYLDKNETKEYDNSHTMPFKKYLEDVKCAYDCLNQIMYIHFIYNIERLQVKYLSFPGVDVPSKHSSVSQAHFVMSLRYDLTEINYLFTLPKSEVESKEILPKSEDCSCGDNKFWQIFNELRGDLDDREKREKLRKDFQDLVKAKDRYDEASARQFMDYLGFVYDKQYRNLKSKIEIANNIRNKIDQINSYRWQTVYVSQNENCDKGILHTFCNTLFLRYNIQNLNLFLCICYDTALRDTI